MGFGSSPISFIFNTAKGGAAMYLGAAKGSSVVIEEGSVHSGRSAISFYLIVMRSMEEQCIRSMTRN